MSSSVLSWDAMLNMTKVEIVLIPGPDIYIFFEKGTRGGASYNSIDVVKGTISISNLIIQNKNQNMLYT